MNIIELTVKSIKYETSEVLAIEFDDFVPALHYLAGQFITLILSIHGKEVRRSYSLTTAPEVDPHLAIAIKRTPNGQVSNYLLRFLKPGDKLKALPPSGRFVVEPAGILPRDIFFIVAGSGIAPVFGMLKFLLMREKTSRLTLIYSSRKENETLFFTQLQHLQALFGGQLECVFIFSAPVSKLYPTAHLNLGLLEQLINQNIKFENDRAEFFLCGPFSFMRMADMIIGAMGFDESKVHKENFVIYTETENISRIPAMAQQTDKWVDININRRSHRLLVPYGHTLLQAADANGLHLPYSCKAGVCGACAAICTIGEIKMSVNEVLTKKDLDKGYILTCVGYPALNNTAITIA